jgi:hypothetical protein
MVYQSAPKFHKTVWHLPENAFVKPQQGGAGGSPAKENLPAAAPRRFRFGSYDTTSFPCKRNLKLFSVEESAMQSLGFHEIRKLNSHTVVVFAETGYFSVALVSDKLRNLDAAFDIENNFVPDSELLSCCNAILANQDISPRHRKPRFGRGITFSHRGQLAGSHAASNQTPQHSHQLGKNGSGRIPVIRQSLPPRSRRIGSCFAPSLIGHTRKRAALCAPSLRSKYVRRLPLPRRISWLFAFSVALLSLGTPG